VRPAGNGNRFQRRNTVARKKSDTPRPAELQRFSRTLNKTRMAAIMGIAGLVFLVAARFFLPPQWVQVALMMFLVGVVSALFSVGGTYLGNCPHCGAKAPYANAFAARSFKCRHCAKRIAVHKTKDGFFFRRA
jgi:hypothetical protein